MHRFYADEAGIRNGMAALAPEDARHACRVLRMQPGDRMELFAGGKRWLAELTELSPEAAACRVLSPLPSTEAALRITLYQGIPKGEKLELIIQKATELGAAAVVPAAMKRSIPRWDSREARKKQERWQRIAREAAKQSGRTALPEIGLPVSFQELAERISRHEAAIVPWEDARTLSLTAFHAARPAVKDLAVVIGPEGGMEAAEIDRLRDAGCLPVTLGPRILRTETAGLAALSALLCLYGEMEADGAD